ncbi:MAG TPA: site-specific integrase [Candidatus Xenobia bacterium]|jgi:site-specific recombinase XerD
MARKDRGVFERPKGSGIWWVLYYDQNGQRHREKVGPKGLALDVYRKRKTQVKEAEFFPELVEKRKPKLTVAVAVEAYMEESKATKRSWQDDARYARYWTEALGKMLLEEVKGADVERWRRQRTRQDTHRGSKVAPATINRAVAFFKRVFNIAIRDGHVTVNPVSKVGMLRENNERVRYLRDDEHEVERLHAAYQTLKPAWASRWHTVALARETGMRQEEQLTLRWEYIDFTRSLIRIPRSKHGEAREIFLNDYVLELLRDLPSRTSSPWVYPAHNPEKHVSQGWLRYPFEAAVKAAGIKNLHWHDARHDFASRLVMKGADLYTVQKLLGHKTPSMTQRYAHLAPKHQLDAVNKLERPATTTTKTATTD